jgi:predicted SnoaL-like aldol condensation-catalyzing enzyme
MVKEGGDMQSISVVRNRNHHTQLVCFGVLLILGVVLSLTLTLAQGSDTLESKKCVTDFYTLAFVKKQVEEAFTKYVGETFIQHNPNIPDGKESSIRFLGKVLRDNPQATTTIKRVIAEDNLVAIHSHLKRNAEDPGRAVIDIFRVEQGKIVEHWDVFQPVPENASNTNGMF